MEPSTSLRPVTRPTVWGLLSLTLGGILLAACAALGGGRLPDAVRTLLAVTFFILLPGGFFVRVLPISSAAKACPEPFCLLYGLGFFALVTAVAARLGNRFVLLAVLVPAAAQLWRLARRRGSNFAPPAFCAALTGALWGLCALTWALSCAHPAAVGENQLKQDFLWTVGNARSFSLGFPPQDIRFAGVRLTYHYLHELVTGGLSAVSGVSCYDLLAFWLPGLWVAGCVVCLYRLGLLLYASPRRAAACTLLAMTAGGCGVFFCLTGSGMAFSTDLLYHLVTNVNACATALCCLAMVSVGLTLAFRSRWRLSFFELVSLLCAFLLLLLGKGPVGLLAVLALFAALAAQLAQRQASGRGALFALVLFAAALAVYRLLFSSGANNMSFGVAGTLLKTDLAALLLAAEHAGAVWYYLALVPLWVLNLLLCSPAVAGLYLLTAWRDVRRLRTLSGERLWLHAAAVGGLLAYYLFDHYAMSQVYFLFLSLWCMAVLDAGLPAPKGRFVCGFAVVCCLAGAAGGLFTAGRLAGQGIRLLLPGGYAAAETEEIKMTAADEEAMDWLSENAPKTAVFATNRYHTGSPLAGNSNLYTALSGRQAYMEGFRYTISNMGVSQQVVDDRFAKNAILFSPKSDAETISQLCRQEGIDYLVFSTQLGERPAAFDALFCCFANEGVEIYALS